MVIKTEQNKQQNIKTKVIYGIEAEQSFFKEDILGSTIYEELEKWLNTNDVNVIAITECNSRWVTHRFTIVYTKKENN